MPITRRQFELGIDDKISQLMREVYGLLTSNKNQAYTLEEIGDHFGIQIETFGREIIGEAANLEAAINALLKIGAIEVREVGRQNYYAFHHPVDTSIWQ
jgi:hypothetical protein